MLFFFEVCFGMYRPSKQGVNQGNHRVHQRKHKNKHTLELINFFHRTSVTNPVMEVPDINKYAKDLVHFISKDTHIRHRRQKVWSKNSRDIITRHRSQKRWQRTYSWGPNINVGDKTINQYLNLHQLNSKHNTAGHQKNQNQEGKALARSFSLGHSASQVDTWSPISNTNSHIMKIVHKGKQQNVDNEMDRHEYTSTSIRHKERGEGTAGVAQPGTEQMKRHKKELNDMITYLMKNIK